MWTQQGRCGPGGCEGHEQARGAGVRAGPGRALASLLVSGSRGPSPPLPPRQLDSLRTGPGRSWASARTVFAEGTSEGAWRVPGVGTIPGESGRPKDTREA